MKKGGFCKSAVGNSREPTRKMVIRVKNVKAGVVTNGLQDPDLKEEIVDTSGCVSLRPSHLRATSPSARANWGI